MSISNRLASIDGMYAIGTILVILGHSHSSDWTTFQGTFIVPLIQFIYIFHMPLFFCIAGFLLMHFNSNTGYLTWISDKSIKLMTPYIFVSFVGGIPKYYYENYTLSGLISYLCKGFIIPRESVWGHLWFIPVLLLLYIIFGLFKHLFSKYKLAWILMGALVLLAYTKPTATNIFALNDLANFALYMFIGMCVKYTSVYQGGD